MLNHKFHFYDGHFDCSCFKEEDFIRISDKLIKKIEPSLKNDEFIEYSSDETVFGLSRYGTVLDEQNIKRLKAILTLNAENEAEYRKFMNFLNAALADKKQVLHLDGSPSYGGLIHNFALRDTLSEDEDFWAFRNETIDIQDQFIMENYNVFKNIEMYWQTAKEFGPGFNYYGITVITPAIAQHFLEVIADYLHGNESEQAAYFIGEEWDTLESILKTAAAENKIIVHFGI
ncbi:hypothetical protein ACYSNR_17160 [Enterococcus sp. LJL128]